MSRWVDAKSTAITVASPEARRARMAAGAERSKAAIEIFYVGLMP